MSTTQRFLIDISKLPQNKVADSEPDFCAWKYKDFLCEMHRSGTGNLCGYCRFSAPRFIPYGMNQFMENLERVIEVHGGVTYKLYEPIAQVCTIGFDTSHLGDLIMPHKFGFPISSLGLGYKPPVYRNFDYVHSHVLNMAYQIEYILSKVGA